MDHDAEIRKAKTHLRECADARLAVERERDDERVQKFRAIDDELRAKYGERLSALRGAEADARAALLTEEDAKARAAAGTTYPVGTVLLHWKRHPYAKPSYTHDGQRGVLEIVTTDSRFGGNISHAPTIGKEIVRLLKKDGTPSLRYDTWISDWRPDGVDPNRAA